MIDHRSVANLQYVVAMVLSGSIGLLVVETGLPSGEVVFYRCLFGAGALGVFCVVGGRVHATRLTVRSLGWMILSGVTMAVNWVLFFRAYGHAPISTVTVIYHFYPFLLLLAGVLLFGEKLQTHSIGWALIAFLGVVCIAAGPDGGAGIGLTGLVLTFAAMTCYAATLLIAKKLGDLPPEFIATVQLAVGTVILIPMLSDTTTGYGHSTWGILVVLGVVHTGLLYVLLYGAVQRLEASTVAILSFLYPATALAFDMLIYAVRPGLLQILGMAAILVAVLGERLGWNGPTKKSIAPKN